MTNWTLRTTKVKFPLNDKLPKDKFDDKLNPQDNQKREKTRDKVPFNGKLAKDKRPLNDKLNPRDNQRQGPSQRQLDQRQGHLKWQIKPARQPTTKSS